MENNEKTAENSKWKFRFYRVSAAVKRYDKKEKKTTTHSPS